MRSMRRPAARGRERISSGVASVETLTPDVIVPSDKTVDEREVRFYSDLADTWWDLDGPFWPLHCLNQLRTEYLQTRLIEWFDMPHSTPPLSGLSIIDIGCGGGILSESMAKLGAKVTGIDIVERNLGVARLHSRSEDLDIDYQLTTASALRRAGEQYDVVLNMEVVEHVADVRLFLSDCSALVRPGGLMAVATINRTWLAYLFAIVGAEHVLRWLPKGTHRWSQFRTPAEIEGWLSPFGLRRIETSGVRVNPVTRSFSLSRVTAVNYMSLFGKSTV